MMTQAQFRNIANLSLTTWEGGAIKSVQTRLHNYHNARLNQRPAKFQQLQAAVEAWWNKRRNLPDSERSWNKRNAMYMLSDQLEAETNLWTRAAAPNLPIENGTRYRRDAETMNTRKDDLPVGQIRVQRNNVNRLLCADARQTRKLQAGLFSERLKNADLLTRDVLDQWEGPRQNISPQALMKDLKGARNAVRIVRSLLPLAPFNNQPQGSHNRYTGIVTSVGHGMQLVEALSEQLVKDEEQQNGTADFLFRYAATSAAARAVGGGVCTHLMTVTAGVLSTLVPANTEILLWFSHYDHQFCVISVNQGPWITVDPWPQKSIVTTWENHCYFPQPQGTRAQRLEAERRQRKRLTEEENYAKITVQNKCEVPYGIPGLLKSAYDILQAEHQQVQAVNPGHPYVHMDSVDPNINLQANQIPHLLAAKPTEWGYACR